MKYRHYPPVQNTCRAFRKSTVYKVKIRTIIFVEMEILPFLSNKTNQVKKITTFPSESNNIYLALSIKVILYIEMAIVREKKILEQQES